MKRRSLTTFVATSALLICGSSAEWSHADVVLDPSRALLLRYDQHLDYDGVSDTLSFIYRDGTIVHSSTKSGLVTHVRGQASAGAMTLLSGILSSSRVGVLEADDCVASSPYPTSASFHNVLVWFGRRGRQNRLTFSAVGAPACPTEVNDIVLALPGFFNSATYVDVVTTTEP